MTAPCPHCAELRAEVQRALADNAVLHALLMRSGFAAFLRLKSQVDPSRPHDPNAPEKPAL